MLTSSRVGRPDTDLLTSEAPCSSWSADAVGAFAVAADPGHGARSADDAAAL